mmetsp:Transcript_4561/g.8792  ORF Transcript_4561/g.8792 Transcript_4561/m.8792 type:complete len:213 (+) Transcript_4561:2274-2912(+)
MWQIYNAYIQVPWPPLYFHPWHSCATTPEPSQAAVLPMQSPMGRQVKKNDLDVLLFGCCYFAKRTHYLEWVRFQKQEYWPTYFEHRDYQVERIVPSGKLLLVGLVYSCGCPSVVVVAAASVAVGNFHHCIPPYHYHRHHHHCHGRLLSQISFHVKEVSPNGIIWRVSHCHIVQRERPTGPRKDEHRRIEFDHLLRHVAYVGFDRMEKVEKNS